MKTEWIKKLLPSEKKSAALLVFAGALGLFLMIAGGGTKQKKEPMPTESGSRAQYVQEMEAKLVTVIQQIEGAGKAQVALTLEAGEETVYALDERSNGEGKGSESQHILMNAQNGQKPLVEMVWEPEIRGIAVVCQGAGEPAVSAQILETVSVLTGVTTNRISIAKMS